MTTFFYIAGMFVGLAAYLFSSKHLLSKSSFVLLNFAFGFSAILPTVLIRQQFAQESIVNYAFCLIYLIYFFALVLLLNLRQEALGISGS
jgi:uncharacterized membrane protein